MSASSRKDSGSHDKSDASVARLEAKIRRILKSPQVPLPPMGEIITNDYGFRRELCPECGQQIVPQYRRGHLSATHGYNTFEWRIKEIAKLLTTHRR